MESGKYKNYLDYGSQTASAQRQKPSVLVEPLF